MANKFELYDSREAAPGSIQVGDIIAATLRLKEIVEEETEGLLGMDFDALARTLDEKNALVARLEKQKKLIRYNRQVLAPYGEAERRDLETVSRELEEALTQNALQLIKAREVNRMVVQAISDAIVRQVGSAQGYSKPGSASRRAPGAAHVVPPMQIDKVI